MAWKILLPQEIMSEGRKLLEDAGHTIIEGRGFETEDVLADMKEHQPDAMIVRITPITREVIEANPNLKVIVRHGAGFDALDVKACHDNGVQTLYAPVKCGCVWEFDPVAFVNASEVYTVTGIRGEEVLSDTVTFLTSAISGQILPESIAADVSKLDLQVGQAKEGQVSYFL